MSLQAEKMQQRHLALTLIAIVFAFVGLSEAAPAQPRHDTASMPAKAKKPPLKRRADVKHRDTRQVACTPFGCQRIPRNCHPEPGFNWDGEPTGFDIVVCR